MTEFEKIYKQTIDGWIKKGDRPTLTEYETKLTEEALKQGANPNRFLALRKCTEKVWNSDGLSFNDIYSIIAKMYEGIIKSKEE